MLSLATLAFLVIATGGCIFSPDSDTGGGGPPVTDPYPFPGTEDQLMANFKKSYDDMERNVYVDDVLNDEFYFVFTEGSPYAPTSRWDRGAEVESVTRMFAGNGGYDTVQGVPKPGVGDVEFRTLIRLTPWEDVPLTDPDFPGARRALYEVEIVFVLIAEQSSTITVSGQQLFYVTDEQVEVDGVTKTRWRLYGQKDLTAET